LEDPDTAVRFAAIQWVGEERLTEFRGELDNALSAGPATSRLFGGYLAALERLDGVVREPSNEWALDQYIVRALNDPVTSPDVLRWSLRMLRTDHEALTRDRLEQFITGKDPQLQLEAVRTLRDGTLPERSAMLSQIASSERSSPTLRAEAIVGLSAQDGARSELLVQLAESNEAILRNEALRSLRGAKLSATQQERLAAVGKQDGARELVDRVLEPEIPFSRPQPEDIDGWLKLVNGDEGSPGDAAAGERIFFHANAAGCSRCHQIVGRGARIGPELTATTSQLTPQRLVESIVRPGKEIAPHFATWLLTTNSGKPLVGMLVKELATGEQTYVDSNGVLHEFKPGEIEARKPQATSIMPDGLAAQLTVQELRDLLAFLQAPESQQ
jgi:putative heme-binding domain-containing protein